MVASALSDRQGQAVDKGGAGKIWRRGGDSNPRYQFTQYDGLANRSFRPLSHLSNQTQIVLNPGLRQIYRSTAAEHTITNPLLKIKANPLVGNRHAGVRSGRAENRHHPYCGAPPAELPTAAMPPGQSGSADLHLYCPEWCPARHLFPVQPVSLKHAAGWPAAGRKRSQATDGNRVPGYEFFRPAIPSRYNRHFFSDAAPGWLRPHSADAAWPGRFAERREY